MMLKPFLLLLFWMPVVTSQDVAVPLAGQAPLGFEIPCDTVATPGCENTRISLQDFKKIFPGFLRTGVEMQNFLQIPATQRRDFPTIIISEPGPGPVRLVKNSVRMGRCDPGDRQLSSDTCCTACMKGFLPSEPQLMNGVYTVNFRGHHQYLPRVYCRKGFGTCKKCKPRLMPHNVLVTSELPENWPNNYIQAWFQSIHLNGYCKCG